MRAFCLFLAFFAAIGVTMAEPREVGFSGYTTRLWEAQDDLPDQTAQAFAQTQDGSLWIGTKGGLLRFDGARFTNYGRDLAPAALSRGVNCLFVSRDGSLWIGTEGGGLIRYKSGLFHAYPTRDRLTNEFIRAIFEDRNGAIWVGADQGLFRVTGSSIARIDNRHGTPAIFVRSFAEDKQGHLWVGGDTLLEFAGGAFLRRYSLPGGPSQNMITSMHSARDGTIWTGTLSGVYRLMPSGVLSRLPGVFAPVSVIEETAGGTLWVGTIGQGLFYRRHGCFFHIAQEKLPSRTVNAVFEDREENLWLGTQTGIVRLSKTPVDIVPFPGGADSTFVTLSNDRDGALWVAASAQLFQIRDGVAKFYTFPGLRNLRVRTLLRDNQNGLWIGTDGAGVLHLSGDCIERFHVGHGLINNFVRAILVAHDGTVWIGTDGGLTHLGPEHSQNYNLNNGLAYFSVTALLEDHGGDIWVGTSRGLSHISRGRIIRDAATVGLQQEQLWSISQDASGEIWFGTSNGLYGFKSGSLVHLTTEQGLASNTIYAILDDSNGNIWLGSPNSISRLRRSDLDRFQFGSRVALTFYEDSSDLDSAELYSGLQPEGAVSGNGDVWFPSNKGALHIAVNRIVPAASSPVRIEEVIAEGRQRPLNREIVLRPGNASLDISYGVIHLGSQDGFRFRYKMEGLESWNEVLNRRTAYYTHLPAGKYRFRVQAFEVGNPVAVSEASIVIEQKPHLYTTLWFLVCSFLVLLGLGFLAHRLRLRQLRMRFDAVSEERARVAREMHDTVIQGCVGVSTLLEAVLGVESGDDPLRQQLLNYATDHIRTTIESAREAVWTLRNTSNATKDPGALCAELARQYQSDSGIPISCQVSGYLFELGDTATHELMMTVREALANAVTHANPKSIQIRACFSRHNLKIQIQDDGCGFSPPANSQRTGHYGILGMQERIRLLRGSVQIQSELGQGTRVFIKVPRRQQAIERMRVANGCEGVSKDYSAGGR
ncbi:MAG: two-component regulator propeller domain-containing protein [Acidobacteriota bacterium]